MLKINIRSYPNIYWHAGKSFEDHTKSTKTVKSITVYVHMLMYKQCVYVCTYHFPTTLHNKQLKMQKLSTFWLYVRV